MKLIVVILGLIMLAIALTYLASCFTPVTPVVPPAETPEQISGAVKTQ